MIFLPAKKLNLKSAIKVMESISTVNIGGTSVICKKLPKREGITTIPQNNELNFIDIKHRNIVEFYGSAKIRGETFLLMEKCQCDLNDFMNTNGASQDDINIVTLQIGNAINFLHSKLIIHRDIKPENILIAKLDGENIVTVKLCDFGFAKQLKSAGEVCRERVGSPIYLAPEFVANWHSTLKSDVWSFAVTIYSLIVGDYPFASKDLDELYANIMNQNYIYVSTLGETNLGKMIVKVLSSQLSERPTIDDIIAAI